MAIILQHNILSTHFGTLHSFKTSIMLLWSSSRRDLVSGEVSFPIGLTIGSREYIVQTILQISLPVSPFRIPLSPHDGRTVPFGRKSIARRRPGVVVTRGAPEQAKHEVRDCRRHDFQFWGGQVRGYCVILDTLDTILWHRWGPTNFSIFIVQCRKGLLAFLPHGCLTSKTVANW